MQETVEYKGHTIQAETHKVGKGFSWSYLIDGANFTESRDRPLGSEDLVLQEAISTARAAIDSQRLE